MKYPYIYIYTSNSGKKGLGKSKKNVCNKVLKDLFFLIIGLTTKMTIIMEWACVGHFLPEIVIYKLTFVIQALVGVSA